MCVCVCERPYRLQQSRPVFHLRVRADFSFIYILISSFLCPAFWQCLFESEHIKIFFKLTNGMKGAVKLSTYITL